MAKARVIIKRRKAVRNIYKITKVMQMIASSRYQKAYRRAMGTKPFVKKLEELVSSAVQAVRASGQEVDHPLMKDPPAGLKKTALLVLTSNRGLCGGYNSSVLRLGAATLNELKKAGDTPDVHVAGKKGVAFLKFQGYKMAGTYTNISDTPKFSEIEPLAEMFMQQYREGKISGLKVVYMRFISMGQQRPAAVELLPLAGIGETEGSGKDGAAAAAEKAAAPVQYDFMPAPAELLVELIPTTVKTALFQAFIEAAVSEQIARMVAMKAATDNAEKLNKKLTQEYNRARQNQITSELAELMGGVEALK
jgi:F-type H+-transporting ATPase subunit gamma